jgi:PTH1 family peptidyl-tRNA hydrolase
MGIGRPLGQQDPADFVLQEFNKSEKLELRNFKMKAVNLVNKLVNEGIESAKNIQNH